MLCASALASFTAESIDQGEHSAAWARMAAALRKAFGVDFSLWHGETADLLVAATSDPGARDPFRGQLARAVRTHEPQCIADEDYLLLLAVPLSASQGEWAVATAAFVVRNPSPDDDLSGAAALLGTDEAAAEEWIRQQPVWPSDALLRLAACVQAQLAAENQVSQLQHEVEKLSDNLASTYEEICLLHGVTQNLRIRSDEEELCALVLKWLEETLPTQSVAMQLLPVAKEGQCTYKCRTQSVLLTSGECPLDNERFSTLIEHFNLEPGCGPLVANGHITGEIDWPFANIDQLVIVPMSEGNRIFGWLAIFNHRDSLEFGTVEASLLNSVASMLGIQLSNRDLYRQQSEFLASVVRALVSAIDAKDPYTSGHSDRVARTAVRLGKELGCDAELLHTLYMAGLLHDIGKIGIDDAVLRKPGALTEAEFEHIKQHPELGYRILADIEQLADVLPAVLHHHEQWDGRGYPFKLPGEQIPLIARILAVADAFDAMTSDRPYRPGMSVEKVDDIFARGAAKQWDPEVIAAFFKAHEDILQIAENERANLTLDVQQWL